MIMLLLNHMYMFFLQILCSILHYTIFLWIGENQMQVMEKGVLVVLVVVGLEDLVLLCGLTVCSLHLL